MPPRRIVALGASNLTRGLHSVVSTSRALWGSDVEIVAAAGHGRSYGARSIFLVRTLPSILDCGLWTDLARRPMVPTRGLVTDVGNDILYGFPPEQILEWVDSAAARLQAFASETILTDLPLATIRALTPRTFLFFRSVFAPRCRLSFDHVLDCAERVNEGLASLAAARGLRFERMRPEWYGLDPIHVRYGVWRSAWRQILEGDRTDHAPLTPGSSWTDAIRLYALRPERETIFGRERYTAQTGVTMPRGGRVWLY